MISIQAQHDTGEHTKHMNSLGASARAGTESTLSDGRLLARLMKLRGTEREVQRRIALDLAEVERRRLYLPRGYGSLFEFCTDYLKYSRSSAARRIGAARCIARFPRMAELFRRGEIDLTVLSVIAGVVTEENCAEIAAWLPGRSLREVEAFVRRRHPDRALRDQVRQIYVTRVTQHVESATDPAQSLEKESSMPGPGAECTVHRTFSPSAGTKTTQPDDNTLLKNRGVAATTHDHGEVVECKASFTFSPSAGTKTTQPDDNTLLKNRGMQTDGGGHSGVTLAERVVVERKFKIQFAVDPAFMDKYKKVLSLLSTKYPGNITFEMAFDIIMTDYRDRYSPEGRMKRRAQRRENRSKRDTENDKKRDLESKEKRDAENTHKNDESRAARTRHIPQAIRDEVFVRDGGRCTYVSKDGRRCEETRNLEIDHIFPYARGGSNSPENLRLLCSAHNRLAAEKEYGREHMEKFYRRE